RRHRRQGVVEVGVEADVREVVVVETGAAQLRVLEVEAERLDEVEPGAGDGREPDRIVGVPGDHGLVEEDVDHAADSPTGRVTARSAAAGARGPDADAEDPGSAGEPGSS